jgi:hemerythrin-like domain-containing protein
MKCTELLIQDHAMLRRALDIVNEMLAKLERGDRIEIADVAAVLKFLRLFGDQYHQTMEEQVLFPALLRAAPHEASLRQLMVEHNDERTLVAEIEDALISKRATSFFYGSRRLTSLLRSHCDREEAIVCDLAERWLSKEQDDNVVAEFMKNRAPEEIHAKFVRLERKYRMQPELARAQSAS